MADSKPWANRIVRTGMAPLAEIQFNSKNWRIHPKAQQDALAGVLSEVGVVQHVIINERTGNLVDGHLRVTLADRNGEPAVPAVYVDLSEEEEALVLATLDPLSAMAATDREQLDALLREVSTGDAAVQAMLSELAESAGILGQDAGSGAEDPGAQIDRAEELRQKWGIERGQLWEIGRHRLLCGDSTSAEDVARLLDGADPCTLVFDPPWDAGIQSQRGDWRSTLVFGDGATVGQIVTTFGAPTWLFAWDCVTSWYTPNRPLRRMKLCVWYGDLASYRFDGAHYGEIVGDDRVVSNTRGSYLYKPDPRGKHLSDVFSAAITREHADGLHRHEKPIDWMRLLVGNCADGDVFDGFLGAGTTMVACEQTDRACYGIEIDPAYAAVTLERMAGMGIDARRADG